jgi:hypothetical protein
VVPSGDPGRQAVVSQRDSVWADAQRLLGEKKPVEAAVKLEETVLLQQRLFGATDPQVADVLKLLAKTYLSTRDVNGARQARAKLLELKTKALGKDHPETIEARLYLEDCSILARLNDAQWSEWAQAEQLTLQAQNLAGTKPIEAARLAGEAAELFSKLAGQEHWLTALTLRVQGTSLDDAGREAEALPPLQRSLTICEKILGPDHPVTGMTAGKLASAMIGVGRLNEAEPVLNGDHPLLKLDNALCTPHTAWLEQDTYESYFGEAFDNILAFLGGKPVNIVNFDVLAGQKA